MRSQDNIQRSIDATPAEARVIAKEAYIWGYALVDDHRIQYAYFIDKSNPEYKGDWNTIGHNTRLYTPDDTTIQTINSDTLYSFIGVDVRDEPIVITVPQVEKERYYGISVFDLWGHCEMLGTRTTGNDATMKQLDSGEITPGDCYGTREYLKNNYLYRTTAIAMAGNAQPKEEVIYPFISVDADGKPLGGINNYTIRFALDQMPPARQFWSITMYSLPQRLLVANPINRYLLNTPMMPNWVKDADGGYTFYIWKAPKPERVKADTKKAMA